MFKCKTLEMRLDNKAKKVSGGLEYLDMYNFNPFCSEFQKYSLSNFSSTFFWHKLDTYRTLKAKRIFLQKNFFYPP